MILEFWKGPDEPNSGWVHCSYKKEGNSEYTKKSLINYAKSNYELGDYDLSIAVLMLFHWKQDCQ